MFKAPGVEKKRAEMLDRRRTCDSGRPAMVVRPMPKSRPTSLLVGVFQRVASHQIRGGPQLRSSPPKLPLRIFQMSRLGDVENLEAQAMRPHEVAACLAMAASCGRLRRSNPAADRFRPSIRVNRLSAGAPLRHLLPYISVDIRPSQEIIQSPYAVPAIAVTLDDKMMLAIVAGFAVLCTKQIDE